MKIMHRNVELAVIAAGLIAITGCVSPDGRQDNTGTGALIGSAVGALAGAASGGEHAGDHALVGALAGAVAGGLVGHVVDADQRRFEEPPPQQYQAYYQPASPPVAYQYQPSQPDEARPPMRVSDIVALTAAGVRPDVIINTIRESNAGSYSPAEIAAAQRANPPIDPAVIACMKQRAG